jgi:hypothetical protein
LPPAPTPDSCLFSCRRDAWLTAASTAKSLLPCTEPAFKTLARKPHEAPDPQGRHCRVVLCPSIDCLRAGLEPRRNLWGREVLREVSKGVSLVNQRLFHVDTPVGDQRAEHAASSLTETPTGARRRCQAPRLFRSLWLRPSRFPRRQGCRVFWGGVGAVTLGSHSCGCPRRAEVSPTRRERPLVEALTTDPLRHGLRYRDVASCLPTSETVPPEASGFGCW